MLNAYKYRLHPTREQSEFFNKSFGCVRFIYNWGLQKRIEAYMKDKGRISYVQLCSMLTDLKKEEQYSWLRDVSTECLQQALRNLDAAFTRFFREKKGFPRFKSKSRSRQSYKAILSVHVDQERRRIKLPKIGWVKYGNNRKFEGDVRSVTVSVTPSGKYHVSVLVDDGKEIPEKLPVTFDTTIGIDMGIKDFAVCSNGDTYENPRHLIKAEQRLRTLQRRLSRKKKGSNRRNRARMILAIQHEKVANRRQDYLHKISTKIVRENQAIVVEDLNIKGMMRNHRLSKAIGACGWSTFFNMLEYKCERQGKTFIRIGRFDPSSKMCSCGHVYKGLKLSEREWVCPNCGSVNDRDLLAACNIKRFGLQEQNLLFVNKPVAHGGSDVEVPTMDDRQEIDLKSSVPVKRQYVKA
jgi:putative transposase